MACGFALVYFVGFVLKSPLSSKLYKETAYSLLLGGLTASIYPLYYRRIYLKTIDSIYD